MGDIITYVNIINIRRLHLPLGILRKQIVFPSKGRGPVHEVQIKVVNPQILQGLIYRPFYIVRVMFIIP